MITNFCIQEGKLQRCSSEAKQVVWTDLLQPTHEERQTLQKQTQTSLPFRNEMHQIEFSNRFYEEQGALYLSVNVLTQALPFVESHVLTFVLTKERVLSLRYSDPHPINYFMNKINLHEYTVKDQCDVFFLLLDTIVGSVADIFELIDERIDELSHKLIRTISQQPGKDHDHSFNKILRDINYLENLSSKGYQSLSSMALLLGYFEQNKEIITKRDMTLEFTSLAKDIKCLQKHAEHLTHTLGFQLQSTLGQINSEQTQIIKIFTVLAMVFMPSTLIASIYGMNFRHMPELMTTYGYPIALIAMALASFLPYLYFKYRKWI